MPMRVVQPGERCGPSVVTVGKFDGIHLGHRALLDVAREEARGLALPWGVVTFDRHPLALLRPADAPPALTPLETKLALLEAAGADFTLLLPVALATLSLSADAFARRILAETAGSVAVVSGDDFRFGSGRAGDLDLLRRLGDTLGFRTLVVPPVTLEGRRVSSYAVRELLSAGDVEGAAAMLGRSYSLEGMVVEGRRLGRELGFPTANIDLPHRVVMPGNGVYAVLADWGSGPKPAVANVGVRPTVEDSPGVASLEVHVLDWSGDLYRRSLRVTFEQRLRDERRFASVDELTEQIRSDAAAARALYLK